MTATAGRDPGPGLRTISPGPRSVGSGPGPGPGTRPTRTGQDRSTRTGQGQDHLEGTTGWPSKDCLHF